MNNAERNKIPQMSDVTRNELLDAMKQLQVHIGKIPPMAYVAPAFTKTCDNCINYTHGEETCSLFKAKPPCAVIVVGCEKWEDDIPF